jgi:hypothetical protein
VKLLSSSLEVEWSQELVREQQEEPVVEVEVRVWAAPLQEHQSGETVIVMLRREDGSHYLRQTEEEQQQVTKWLSRQASPQHIWRELQETRRQRGALRQLTALEGGTGRVVWQTDPRTHRGYTGALLGPLQQHLGGVMDLTIQPWFHFAPAFEQLLPVQAYRYPMDAQLQLAAFKKHAAVYNHSDTDYNVIVAAGHLGLEVYHLYSGHPVSQLLLTPNVLYMDLENHGLIQSVFITQHCLAKMKVGLPAQHAVSPIRLCEDLPPTAHADVSFAAPFKLRRTLLFLRSDGTVLAYRCPSGTSRLSSAPIWTYASAAAFDDHSVDYPVVYGLFPFRDNLFMACGTAACSIFSEDGIWQADMELLSPLIRPPTVLKFAKDPHFHIAALHQHRLSLYTVRPAAASKLLPFIIFAFVTLFASAAYLLTNSRKNLY